MCDEQPLAIAFNENIRGLHHGLIETFRKRGSDPRRARNPSYGAFHPDLNIAENHVCAFRICENPRPAFAYFLPAIEQVPTGLNALHGIVMRPDCFHFGDI